MALYHRFKRQFLSKVNLVRLVLVVVGMMFLVSVWRVVLKPVGQKVSDVWEAYNYELPSHDGRTNFLLLGVAGGDHDGANLTDTIIFASIRHSDGKVNLLTIPRDIWVNSMKAKINTAFYYGEQKKEGGGFVLAKSAVTEIIDQPVHFVAMIDFSSFENVIDALGGVSINVERSFDDFRYPIPGRENDLCNGDPEYLCRFEHLHFDAGTQIMDGKTALKYVRSRQADGEEGTDFARSARQEKLLLAIKDELLSRKTITNLNGLKTLSESMSAAVVTDVTPDLYPALAKLALVVSGENRIETSALSQPDHLYNPPISSVYDRQWVLVPKNDDIQLLYDYVSNLLGKQ
jgi:polyisoprenyl-teichoic acid--peptidoglycan teichoic acid transferase